MHARTHIKDERDHRKDRLCQLHQEIDADWTEVVLPIPILRHVNEHGGQACRQCNRTRASESVADSRWLVEKFIGTAAKVHLGPC